MRDVVSSWTISTAREALPDCTVDSAKSFREQKERNWKLSTPTQVLQDLSSLHSLENEGIRSMLLSSHGAAAGVGHQEIGSHILIPMQGTGTLTEKRSSER